jgi:membrane protease YdiL (CAAX protease family)
MVTKKHLSVPGKSSLFITLAYLFSWLVWMPGVLFTRGLIGKVPWLPLFALGTCGPLVAALWCIWRTDGRAGVKDWLKKGFSRLFSWSWWAFIVLGPFLVPTLVWVIYRLSGGDPYSLPVFQNPWNVLPAILLMVTIGGGQEEYGWRGYLLPRLDSRWKPWQADLFLIVVHSLWHLPLFFISATAQSTYPFWVFLVFGSGLTMIINRVYRSTGGSLLAAILFHGMVNAGLETFPPVGAAVGGANWPFLLAGLCYAVLAWMTRPRGETK